MTSFKTLYPTNLILSLPHRLPEKDKEGLTLITAKWCKHAEFVP